MKNSKFAKQGARAGAGVQLGATSAASLEAGKMAQDKQGWGAYCRADSKQPFVFWGCGHGGERLRDKGAYGLFDSAQYCAVCRCEMPPSARLQAARSDYARIKELQAACRLSREQVSKIWDVLKFRYAANPDDVRRC